MFDISITDSLKNTVDTFVLFGFVINYVNAFRYQRF